MEQRLHRTRQCKGRGEKNDSSFGSRNFTWRKIAQPRQYFIMGASYIFAVITLFEINNTSTFAVFPSSFEIIHHLNFKFSRRIKTIYHPSRSHFLFHVCLSLLSISSLFYCISSADIRELKCTTSPQTVVYFNKRDVDFQWQMNQSLYTWWLEPTVIQPMYLAIFGHFVAPSLLTRSSIWLCIDSQLRAVSLFQDNMEVSTHGQSFNSSLNRRLGSTNTLETVIHWNTISRIHDTETLTHDACDNVERLWRTIISQTEDCSKIRRLSVAYDLDQSCKSHAINSCKFLVT